VILIKSWTPGSHGISMFIWKLCTILYKIPM
jgi:hypothetical protein